jgi:uncharacterized protein YqgC (DUF456 family)
VEILGHIGGWAWYLIWAGLLLLASLLVYVGLGGNFIILALALIHALATGFDPIRWRLLVILLLMALIGEGIEFLVGTFYVAKKGAGRSGVIGAFLGGLLGAIAGAPIVPLLGAIIGSFIGAFLGAVLGEYHQRRRLEPSLRIGGHAFMGKLAAVLVKHAIGLVMVALVLKATWPS